MDERKLAIVVGVALILMIFMGFLLMPRKGSHQDQGSDRSSQSRKNNGKQGTDNNNSSGSSGYAGNGAGEQNPIAVVSAPPARGFGHGESGDGNITGAVKQAFSEEEMQEFRNNRDELRRNIYEKKLDWLKDKSKDPKLSAKSQVRYRLKLIEGFRDGNTALNNGDYAEAIKQYMAGAKDPEGCPVTRYVCFDQMRYAARMMKDHDLYLEILKEQAKLIASDDLAVLGIEKSDSGYVLYNRRKLFVQALKSPDGMRQAVDEYMASYKLKEESREDAEKEFVEDFEEWKKTFDLPG